MAVGSPKARRSQTPEELALELLLEGLNPQLQTTLAKCSSLSGFCKEVVDLLRAPPAAGAASLCGAEDLASLGERALELEELEDIVRSQWTAPTEQQAAHKKLLSCGIDSPQKLHRALIPKQDGRCLLNRLLEEANFKCLRQETILGLTADVEARIRQRMDLTVEGARAVLVTAPHNVYLRRDGQPPHVMEEYTTLIAGRIARQVGGVCLAWSRAEQRRSELLWFLARRQGVEPGVYLDPRNRDPNYLSREEVLQNPWFYQMQRLAERWQGPAGLTKPSLHVDVHGCRDPPCTPSHLTVGLAAMRYEVEAGRSSLSVARLETFGTALHSELSSVLSSLDLGHTRSPLVRVLWPPLTESRDSLERLSGAWPLEERRVTQSQQAVAFAGFTHSCQLELSKSLRRAFTRDEAATARLGAALERAWLASTSSASPLLPRVPLGSTHPGSFEQQAADAGLSASGRLRRAPRASSSSSATASPTMHRGGSVPSGKAARSGGLGGRSCPPRMLKPSLSS